MPDVVVCVGRQAIVYADVLYGCSCGVADEEVVDELDAASSDVYGAALVGNVGPVVGKGVVGYIRGAASGLE